MPSQDLKTENPVQLIDALGPTPSPVFPGARACRLYACHLRNPIRPSDCFARVLHGVHAEKQVQRGYFSAQISQSLEADCPVQCSFKILKFCFSEFCHPSRLSKRGGSRSSRTLGWDAVDAMLSCAQAIAGRPVADAKLVCVLRICAMMEFCR
jgi:hypothetical protein